MGLAQKPGGAAPLRLAFFTHSFPLPSEGFIATQAVALIEAGHEVDIYAVWGLNNHDPQRFPVVEQARLMERAYEPHFEAAPPRRLLGALRLARSRFSGRGSVLRNSLDLRRHGRWALNLRLLYETAMLDGRGPYDAVHCQFADLAPVVLRLRDAGALDCPVVVHLRGIDFTRRVREFGPDVYRQIFRAADLLLANCAHFRHRAIALGCDPAKIEVHGTAIDLAAFPYRGPRRYRALLRLAMVGRLVEKKGVQDAIEAVALLHERGLRVRLDILGDGPLRSQLQALIVERGLGDQVRLLGAAGQAEVLGLLHASDLLLAPSVTAEDGDEDSPMNAIKEAMCLGLPVVATRHDGIPELVQDGINGLLVPERDPAALASALIRLSNEPQNWERMGRAGRAAVAAEYDSLRQTRKLVAWDRSLLARHRAARNPPPAFADLPRLESLESGA